MPRAKQLPAITSPLQNPENVKIVPFTGQGEDPASLVGLLLIATTPEHQYPLTLSFRQPRKAPRDVEIHSSVLGRFFNIEICDLLREHLPKATGIRPLKVIAAAFGSKKVEYAAPYSLKRRNLFRKKRVDQYNLIGLQLQGMDRMGWIWAEDLDRSFEEGQLKASVYIPKETVTNTHRPRRMARLSAEDLNKIMTLAKASSLTGGLLLIRSVLGEQETDKNADLSPAQVKRLQELIDIKEAGRNAIPLLAVDRNKTNGNDNRTNGIIEELSDFSELSDHDSLISADGMDVDQNL